MCVLYRHSDCPLEPLHNGRPANPEDLLFTKQPELRKPLKFLFTRLLLTGLFMVLLAPAFSFAQTPADILAAERQAEILQRQEQERRQRDQEEARRRAAPVEGLDTEALKPKISVPDIGAPCREISVITILGAPNLSVSVRKRITAEFTGRCLNIGDIERILAEITKSYIDRGFITTRAYLPPQDLSTGYLKILVIEGVVEDISIEDGGTNSISIGNVLPGVRGSLLNLRDLEQGIDQINRLSSNNAQLDIRPGKEAGSSLVVVHNQPRLPYHLGLSFDNQGSESTGKTQTGLTLGADNLLRLNEMFSVTHRESLPGDHGRKFSQSDSADLSIPYGYTSFSLGTSYSKYDSTILVPSGLSLVSSGNNRANYGRLDQVVYRDKSTRASLSVALTNKEAQNYLGGELLSVSSRKLTILDLDTSLTTGLAGGVLTLSVGYAQGLTMMGALRDQENLPEEAPRAQFGKFKAGLNYMRPFRILNHNASFTSQVTAQKANDTLYGSEQISIGGLYSVRGFVKNSLSGDHGYYCRNEISVRQPVTIKGQTISTRYYAGYDFGWVQNRPTDIADGHLSGMVVGLSANWSRTTFDLFATQPLNMPDSMTRESTQTWLRLAFSI